MAQDAGRGRQGRDWVSQTGNFFGSTVIDIAPGDPPAQSLALACGLALVDAVDTAVPGLPLMLKWPNDLLLDGAKVAGILLERQDQRVVAGFGVNLASAPQIEGRAVANLGGAISPQAFAPLLAASMARMLPLWRTSAPPAFAQAWLARAHPPGTRLRVHVSAEEMIEGNFAGIAPDGALRLLMGDGREELVRAGDVALG